MNPTTLTLAVMLSIAEAAPDYRPPAVLSDTEIGHPWPHGQFTLGGRLYLEGPHGWVRIDQPSRRTGDQPTIAFHVIGNAVYVGTENPFQQMWVVRVPWASRVSRAPDVTTTGTQEGDYWYRFPDGRTDNTDYLTFTDWWVEEQGR